MDGYIGFLVFVLLGLSEQSSIKTVQKLNASQYSNQTFQQASSVLSNSNRPLLERQYPPPSSCNCYYQDSCGCLCQYPITWEEFQILPQSFRSCPGFTLALRGGNGGGFYAFPADYFYRVGDVRDFVLDVSSMQFVYLLDPGGQTSALNRVRFEVSGFLRFHQVSISKEWNWKGFYELTPTRPLSYCEIQVVQSTVPLLTADFGLICKSVVTVVNINYCGTMALENKVFAPFYKLNEVNLSNNRIRVILRSYFPHPAEELEVFNLAYNDIRSLPNDMFYGMPSLESVDLRGNPITTVNAATFRPILQNVEVFGIKDLYVPRNKSNHEESTRTD